MKLMKNNHMHTNERKAARVRRVVLRFDTETYLSLRGLSLISESKSVEDYAERAVRECITEDMGRVKQNLREASADGLRGGEYEKG
jgi:hypothetical protein